MSSFLDKAKALGGKAVEATADAVEIGTLKAKIAARKGDIEKQYEALGEIIYENRSTLELNPEHPLVKQLAGTFKKDGDNSGLVETVGAIYDLALVAEGSQPRNPLAFTKFMASRL